LLLLLGRGFAWEEFEDSVRGKEEETQVLILFLHEEGALAVAVVKGIA
jgi:hypothetical protein